MFKTTMWLEGDRSGIQDLLGDSSYLNFLVIIRFKVLPEIRVEKLMLSCNL